MFPGVVLPIGNTGSYGSSPHIVRTAVPFHLLVCSHACEQKVVAFGISLTVQTLDLICERVKGFSHYVCHFSLTFCDLVDQFVHVRK
jgi:hypothetical protein